MKYMIASDYDGTLYQMGVVSQKTVEKIKEFQSRGHLFGVVTGRDYVNGFELFKNRNDFPFDFIISNNGAAAYDKDGNIYFSQKADGRLPCGESTLAENLIKRCLQLTSKTCGIAFERGKFEFHPDYPLGERVEDKVYSALSVLKDVSEFVSANALCSSNAHAAGVVDALTAEFGAHLTFAQNNRCIDITQAGVDKTTGIKQLAECLNIHHEHIWTAGDNFNDISMIKSYHGCAMSHGVEELRKASEYICNNVADVIEIVLSQ